MESSSLDINLYANINFQLNKDQEGSHRPTLTLYCSVTMSWCNVGQEVCVTPAATATQPVIWSRLLCACERHLQDEAGAWRPGPARGGVCKWR